MVFYLKKKEFEFVIFKQTFSYLIYYWIIPVAYCVDDSLDLELSEAGPPLKGSGDRFPRSLAENEAALYRQWLPLAAQEPAPAGAAHTAHPLPAGGANPEQPWPDFGPGRRGCNRR